MKQKKSDDYSDEWGVDDEPFGQDKSKDKDKSKDEKKKKSDSKKAEKAAKDAKKVDIDFFGQGV